MASEKVTSENFPASGREERRVHTEERVGGLLVQKTADEPERFLLVPIQTGNPHQRPKWGLPMSRIQGKENIVNGAERAVREITSWNVHATSLLNVGSRYGYDSNNYTSFVFKMGILPGVDFDRPFDESTTETSSKSTDEDTSKGPASQQELPPYKWFSYEEINELAKDLKLHHARLITDTIENYFAYRYVFINFPKLYPNKTE